MNHGIRKEIVKFSHPVDDLVPYPGNARRGNVDAIVASLEAHGQYRPIVARRETKEVLAGNHTLAAVRQMGWTHIAVAFVEVGDDQAREIVLVDNRTNDLASYDDQALADLLQEAQASEHGLIGTGFEDEDLEALLEKLSPDPPAEPEPDPEEPEVFGVAVACGNEEQREALMAQLTDWGYTPAKLNGRWDDRKS